MPTTPSASSRTSSAAKPRPSSSTIDPNGAVALCQHDAHAFGSGVLDDVRQGLLDDAVEHGLGLRWAAVRPEGSPRAPSAMPVRSSKVSPGARRPLPGRSRRARSGGARPRADARPAAPARSARAGRPRPCRRRPRSGQSESTSIRAGSRSAPARSRRGARARAGRVPVPAPPPRGAPCRAATRSDRSTATAARAAKISVNLRSASVKRGSRPSLSLTVITPIGRPRAISGTYRAGRGCRTVVPGPDRPRCPRGSSRPERCARAGRLCPPCLVRAPRGVR